MNFKEHLQFLAMMVPTLLLLAALFISLAYPAQGTEANAERPALGQTSVPCGNDAEFDDRRLGGEARRELLAV
jgi:hypothetical protein